MRFIRKGGRIIPIREKGEPSQREKAITSAKRYNFASGALLGLTMFGVKASKVNTKLFGYGASLGLTLTSMVKTANAQKNDRFSERSKNERESIGRYGLGGVALGFGGGIGGLVGLNILKKSGKLNKATRYAGDKIFDVKEALLTKKVKNVDLSKGAKTFKGKYNQLSGLIGR